PNVLDTLWRSVVKLRRDRASRLVCRVIAAMRCRSRCIERAGTSFLERLISVRTGALLALAAALSGCTRGAPSQTPRPVQRLLGVCAGVASSLEAREPHVTLGFETRAALTATSPWRCEATVTPKSGLMLAFALGASAGVSGPPCRVYFQTTDGRRDLIHETPRI